MLSGPLSVGSVVGFNIDTVSFEWVKQYVELLYIAGYTFKPIAVEGVLAVRVTGFNVNCN